MNQFGRKINVLFVIVGIVSVIVCPQGVNTDYSFNESEPAVIELSGTGPFEIISTDGGYDVTLSDNILTVSAPNGAVYVTNRENEEETILSCGQKVLVSYTEKDGNGNEETKELTGYYEGKDNDWTHRSISFGFSN